MSNSVTGECLFKTIITLSSLTEYCSETLVFETKSIGWSNTCDEKVTITTHANKEKTLKSAWISLSSFSFNILSIISSCTLKNNRPKAAGRSSAEQRWTTAEERGSDGGGTERSGTYCTEPHKPKASGAGSASSSRRIRSFRGSIIVTFRVRSRETWKTAEIKALQRPLTKLR